MSENHLFNLSAVKEETIRITLKEVCDSLEEKGYTAQMQLVGYLMTGDEKYISNFQNAREKLLELNRADIIAYLVKESLK